MYYVEKKGHLFTTQRLPGESIDIVYDRLWFMVEIWNSQMSEEELKKQTDMYINKKYYGCEY